MEKDKANIQQLPWFKLLLIEINTKHFMADDEDFFDKMILAESCMPYAEAPYNLDGLDDEDSFSTELSKLINQYWPGTKRELCEQALIQYLGRTAK